jgi:group I intron endonuclease
MPKKLTINYIKDVFEKEGCTLLENNYIGNRQRLRIRLLNGEKYYTTWLSWQQGKRPWRNPNNSRPTIEEIRKSFEDKGYTLLSNEYINCKTKLDFICDRGHKHSIGWFSWKEGYVCRFCAMEDRRNKPKYKVCNSDSSIKLNGIIYKVTNKVNNKIYIGQTIYSLYKRKIKHISLANSLNIKTHFHKAINKYGKDNFIWQTLCNCKTKCELDEKEIYYIKHYNTYKDGYNMTLGGEGTIGRVCKESTKIKISKACVGRKISEETKKKISDATCGVKKSKEHKANAALSKSKYWKVTYPGGTVEIIRNLSAFCRKNNISDRGMWMVSKGQRAHHKGFKCKKLANTGAING